MQVDGEHMLQPFPDLPRASLVLPIAFPISRPSPFPLTSPESPVSPHCRHRVHAAGGWSKHIDESPGQRWGPATRSAFFRRDIGGETQGIQRFQSLEGVE
jgi:hypothetical protein